MHLPALRTFIKAGSPLTHTFAPSHTHTHLDTHTHTHTPVASMVTFLAGQQYMSYVHLGMQHIRRWQEHECFFITFCFNEPAPVNPQGSQHSQKLWKSLDTNILWICRYDSHVMHKWHDSSIAVMMMKWCPTGEILLDALSLWLCIRTRNGMDTEQE